MFGHGIVIESVDLQDISINQHTLLIELLGDNAKIKSYEVSISSTFSTNYQYMFFKSLWETCHGLVMTIFKNYQKKTVNKDIFSCSVHY